MAFFQLSMASNSEVNGLMWPEFELVRDVIAALVTCKCEADSIKSESAIIQTTFSLL